MKSLLTFISSAPKRPLGPAELLVEACFTDMRHNGDGDLSTVYRFAHNKVRFWGENVFE